MGFERNSFDTVTENITEAENSVLFDEFNYIPTNKLAVILAQGRDKAGEDMQMPFWLANVQLSHDRTQFYYDWWNILGGKKRT